MVRLRCLGVLCVVSGPYVHRCWPAGIQPYNSVLALPAGRTHSNGEREAGVRTDGPLSGASDKRCFTTMVLSPTALPQVQCGDAEVESKIETKISEFCSCIEKAKPSELAQVCLCYGGAAR